ncbi:MAG: hypothetical protein ABIK28_09935, partial [Planctomycetota bacterium]
MGVTAIISLVLFLNLSSEPALSVSYHVSIENPNSRMVDVRAEIKGLLPEHNPLHMKMADQYAFVRLDEPLLEGEVRAEDGFGHSLPLTRRSSYSWTLDTRDSNEVVLSYRVPLRHSDLPIVKEQNDVYEQPFLDSHYGMLVSGTLILWPENTGIFQTRVSFSLPDGWEVICPWKELDNNTFAPTMKGALDDLVAIGQWSKHIIEADGMTITVAFTPGQKMLEEAAIPLIEKIVKAELSLFKATPNSKYLFLFGKPIPHGFGGSPKNGSMILAVDSKFESVSKQYPIHRLLGHLVAHEFFHLWGSLNYQCPDELRFFSEGFTDYYAYLILAREGILDKTEFLKLLCERMKASALNPLAGEISLAEAGGRPFFTDKNAENLIYKGGMVMAALLDSHLRKAKSGACLDLFMQELNNDPRWVLGETAPDLDVFLGSIESYLGTGSADHFAALIKNPFSLDPVKEFALAGIEVKRTVSKEEPDLRGNLDEKTGTTLLDLDPGGLAYAMGIRPNDRFVKINGVEPATRGDVYKAWSNPANGRIRVTYIRDGKTFDID